MLALLWIEEKGEGHADDKGEGCKDKPSRLPVAEEVAVLPLAEMVDYLAGGKRAHSGTDAVGHHHEEPLGRCLDAGLALLVDEDTARDIEEVEGNTIDNARQDEEQHAGHGGIANAEEAEAEHPSEHGHKHDDLDAVTAEEEGYEEYAQGLANL